MTRSSSALYSLAGRVSAAFRHDILFLLGGPGSGKGSIGARLCEVGWGVVSAGELLRTQAETDESVRSTLARGDVVSPMVSSHAILTYLEKVRSPLVIDGFPRTLESAVYWKDLGAPVGNVLVLDVPPAVMRDRLAKRGREDDGRNVVEKRLHVQNRELPKVISFLKRYADIAIVDGAGSPEQVWTRIQRLVSSGQFPWLVPKCTKAQ